MSRVRTSLSWVFCAVFLWVSARKLLRNPSVWGVHALWGVPHWLTWTLAGLEGTFGLLLLAPRTRTVAAAGLFVIVLSATVLYTLHAQWTELPGAMLSTAGLAWIAVGRPANAAAATTRESPPPRSPPALRGR